jgi:hypothetical protein
MTKGGAIEQRGHCYAKPIWVAPANDSFFCDLTRQHFQKKRMHLSLVLWESFFFAAPNRREREGNNKNANNTVSLVCPLLSQQIRCQQENMALAHLDNKLGPMKQKDGEIVVGDWSTDPRIKIYYTLLS